MCMPNIFIWINRTLRSTDKLDEHRCPFIHRDEQINGHRCPFIVN